MEMKGSRRPFDGPRVEPGLKKARLAEDAAPDLSSSGRGFIQQRPVSSRFQHSDRGDAESSDSVRGPFPPQQHHELVRQYKAALAELTFNSKPIITNLTIIAGENSHAARGIAATICTHILEVSSEQKLPSLYLLDSIVKNIGRDYIKHFATRLPEVFCKAYRQVDPSIHHGMRHLFGTWKGVFPPQTLQLIEKDLGFTTGVNVSTSRTESQSSRPAHSIHVNPKYLEARQRMQQSTRTKGTVGEISETLKISGEGVESLNRTASVSFIPRRSWVDPSIKGELNEPVAEYGSTVSKHPDMGVGRMSGQVKEQVLDKRWHDFSSKSSGYDLKHEFQNYPSHKSASHDALNKSWKNSEEEEYMWDDITSRVPHATKSLVKDHWTLDDSGRMDLECQLQRSQIMKEIGLNFDSDTSTDSLSTENKRQASFGHQVSSSWSREPHSFDGARHPDSARNISSHSEGYHNSFSGLSTAANSIGRTSFQPRTGTVPIGSSNNGLSLNAAPEYAGLIAKQREPRQTASPSSHSTMHQRSPSPSISTHSSSQITRKVGDRDQTHTISQVDSRTSQIPRSTLDPRQKFYQEYLPTLSRNAHLDISQRRALQGRNNVSLPEPLASEPQEFESIHQAEKPVVSVIPGYTKPLVTQSSLSNASKHSGAESPGQASTSSLLAAVMRSGILSSDTLVGSLPGLNSQDSVSPPLPSCSSPTQPVDIPPNVPSSNVTNSDSNPVSSLLSTLVAKGLITASKTQSPTAVESKIAPQIPIRSPPTVSKNSSVVSSVPASVSPSSSKAEELSKPATKTSDIPAKSATREIKNLIGLVFKPDVIRQPHPIVISELLDDIPHQCSMCGLRLKLKEQLDRHLDWHASRNPDMKLLNKAPRKWYSSSAEWVAGNGSFNKGSCKIMESSEPMVLADERQCICMLCGEVFEDIFSEDSNRWMFKGAVYMSSQSLGDNCESANKEGIALGPIVHKNCISETSLHDLGLVQDDKQEKDT